MLSSRKWIVGVILGWASLSSFAEATSLEKFYENSSGSPLLPLLKSAKSSIDIEIYEMNDPLVLGALTAAVNEGVKVRIVQEDMTVGAPCKVFEPMSNQDNANCQERKKLVKAVRKSGGQYVPFNDSELCGAKGTRCFQHGKMAIVDGHSALLSTGNFNTTSLCNKKEHPDNCNRDYTILSKDPNVISALQSIFEKDLQGAAYDLPAILNQSNQDKLTVSPLSMKPLVNFIRSAKTSIQIQNQYLKDPDLNAEILAAAKRGVRIEIVVSSVCSFGRPSPSESTKWKKTYSEFESAGISVWIFTRRMKVGGVSGYLHAKAMVVDGERAWVGSVNGSTLSITNNREFGIFLNDSSEVSTLVQFMNQDFNDQAGETWQDSLVCKYDPPPTPQKPEEK